ncbi:hypothetical protein LX32DRAFT_258460 [Colletotrichum zoysiae]|uniref:Uncharacterized protein n=1 Tax=Colletotrichum zoysiae TaxID=1216348 RepID=A0AAD9LX28_9PEZI|nr:hypothetical protein LX32DRAFT_258460 [Colletotrichum zoysiae]
MMGMTRIGRTRGEGTEGTDGLGHWPRSNPIQSKKETCFDLPKSCPYLPRYIRRYALFSSLDNPCCCCCCCCCDALPLFSFVFFRDCLQVTGRRAGGRVVMTTGGPSEWETVCIFGWFGLVWSGLAWFGLVWFGLVCAPWAGVDG